VFLPPSSQKFSSLKKIVLLVKSIANFHKTYSDVGIVFQITKSHGKCKFSWISIEKSHRFFMSQIGVGGCKRGGRFFLSFGFILLESFASSC
jgi:hypothetical protein